MGDVGLGNTEDAASEDDLKGQGCTGDEAGDTGALHLAPDVSAHQLVERGDGSIDGAFAHAHGAEAEAVVAALPSVVSQAETPKEPTDAIPHARSPEEIAKGRMAVLEFLDKRPDREFHEIGFDRELSGVALSEDLIDLYSRGFAELRDYRLSFQSRITPAGEVWLRNNTLTR